MIRSHNKDIPFEISFIVRYVEKLIFVHKVKKVLKKSKKPVIVSKKDEKNIDKRGKSM